MRVQHAFFYIFFAVIVLQIQALEFEAGCGLSCTKDDQCTMPLKCISNRCDDKPLGSNITSIQATPANCDPFCCKPGRNYSLYYCSPEKKEGTMIAITSDGYTGYCGAVFNSTKPQVAMPTGWFDNGRSCNKSIVLSNGNASVSALVIDKCDSSRGCDQVMSYHPPCDRDTISATNAVWRALGIIKNASEGKSMKVSWEFEAGELVPPPPSSGFAQSSAPLSCIIWTTCRSGFMVFLIVLVIGSWT